jgi:hypothetical protein
MAHFPEKAKAARSFARYVVFSMLGILWAKYLVRLFCCADSKHHPI